MRALYLTLEKLIQPEETQVNGIVILADYTGVGMSQASNPGPFLAKKVVSILQVWDLPSSDLFSNDTVVKISSSVNCEKTSCFTTVALEHFLLSFILTVCVFTQAHKTKSEVFDKNQL